MPVDASLVSAVSSFTQALLARDDFDATRAAVGLVTCAAQLIGDDVFDRQVLIATLRSTADELENARRIVN
jgi:hypothetical protein